MTFCPFCGVRQDVNLRQIHFRDLGTDESLPCPGCAAPLDVIEFETDPAIRIERCTACYGTFFNPGELESNAVLLATDADGRIRITNNSPGTARVILDITGWVD